MPIPFEIEKLTGIDDNMVLGQPGIDVILPRFLAFCGDAVLVAHNASFDVSFISHNAAQLGLPFSPTVLDTVSMARVLLPALNRYKLDVVAKALDISLENHHRAVDDAGATARIFARFVEMLRERGIETLDQLDSLSEMTAEAICKLPTYHVIILAKNDLGRINLYRLVSLSHLEYFSRRPRIPKSLLAKYREGLIIGSACEAGELFQAVVRGAPAPELARLASFYDYLEIQPLGNNQFMLRDEKSTVKTEQDLIDLNLSAAGYHCTSVQDGIAALDLIEEKTFDLILLDVMLPGVDGYDIMEYIRPLKIPVIFITARYEVRDRVKGLRLGADDYLVKPFDVVELVARVEAVLRRYHKADNTLSALDVVVDVDGRQVTKNGVPVVLTNKEFGLLVLFIRNKNVALFRETLYEQVWGGEYTGDSRTLDLHVQRLRKKLGWEHCLAAVYKVGYRLEVPG